MLQDINLASLTNIIGHDTISVIMASSPEKRAHLTIVSVTPSEPGDVSPTPAPNGTGKPALTLLRRDMTERVFNYQQGPAGIETYRGETSQEEMLRRSLREANIKGGTALAIVGAAGVFINPLTVGLFLHWLFTH